MTQQEKRNGIKTELSRILTDEVINYAAEHRPGRTLKVTRDELMERLTDEWINNDYSYVVNNGRVMIFQAAAVEGLLNVMKVPRLKNYAPNKWKPNCVYIRKGPTGKIYVGKTDRTVEARAKEDGFGYAKNPKMWIDILTYGWDSFETEIVASGLTPEDADELETELIKKYDSVRTGYNQDDKGTLSEVDA